MNLPTSQSLETLGEPDFVPGQSLAIRSVNAVVVDVAHTDIPVLLTGESGTGKEVYARLIHRLSGLEDSLFKKLSCTALDASRLLGQAQETLGLNSIDGRAGTVFLDGVDELDLGFQGVLLSLLPDGELKGGARQLGGRIISSTSHNLENKIEAGHFRRDLYFRINGLCLRLPPLRERKEDILTLLEFFLLKHAGEQRRKTPPLENDVMDVLTAYSWPGNIRELENVAKKIVALGDTEAALRDLRNALLSPPKLKQENHNSLKVAARAASRRTEKELILQALERTHWNRKRAAKELQISYKALLYKIKQVGIPVSESEE
jgi:two-component system response regulator AtoC